MATPVDGPGWTATDLGGSVKVRIMRGVSLVLTVREGVSPAPFHACTPTLPRTSFSGVDIKLNPPGFSASSHCRKAYSFSSRFCADSESDTADSEGGR